MLPLKVELASAEQPWLSGVGFHASDPTLDARHTATPPDLGSSIASRIREPQVAGQNDSARYAASCHTSSRAHNAGSARNSLHRVPTTFLKSKLSIQMETRSNPEPFWAPWVGLGLQPLSVGSGLAQVGWLVRALAHLLAESPYPTASSGCALQQP
ncbi:hypothetical protein L1887_45971 [Cichorium endivia]|nr:hypothetical protein L1887_45971 [Cichorium endivia]